jgi:hypothetical protein
MLASNSLERNIVKRIITVLILSTIFFAAIGASQNFSATAATDTETPDTTLAPDTTEAPDTTLPGETTVPDGLAGSNAPWWILILVGLGILILIVVFASRGSKEKIVPPPPMTKSWKEHAREGYASSRWLYDAMGEDMAVWRGNAQFDNATAVGTSAATSRAETWQKLNERMTIASDSLYALEAAAPDQRSAQAARNTVNALHSTRNALDARAESRFAYRSAETQEHDSTSLMQAREREVRSSRNLVEARNNLALALTDLSTIA